MIESVIQNSMTRKAIEKGILDIHIVNPRDFTSDSYRQIDDTPYGGGPGMVMMAEPLFKAIDFVIEKFCGDDGMRVLYPSPQGIAWSQDSAEENKSVEKIVIICANIEDRIMGLDKNERETFMKEIGLNKTGLNQLIKEGYDLLKLNTFFTSGPEESRAWTIKKNTLAPKAASVIHTDFEKNFIRAEAVSCEDFIKYGSAEKCKENGKLRIEGKDYIVKDGDVLYFRVNP